MNPPPDDEVVIFNAALELPPGQRVAYLEEACVDNLALRLQVEALLGAHESAGAFLEMLAPGAQEPIADELRAAANTNTCDASEKPGDRIGRYKLLQKIGEGGCGVVYMAEQQEPVRRSVALKVIKLGMDTRQVIARFEAERQALALMDHPNIARVFDAGATAVGRPFFVMELIRGIPITRYCDEHKLGTASRLGLFVQVCQAVQHAHQKGIIHRDIKPSNVLVAEQAGFPVPKVIDFGIAKATNDQRLTDNTLFTTFNQFIGTAAYMAPEQANLSGLDVDTRSDIYSLGVLLFELLTGKTPFDGKRMREAGLDEMRRIIQQEEPQRPSTRFQALDAAEQKALAKERQSEPPKLVHLLRGDLDWIVMKALDKDRNHRYSTANGLAMDVQRFLKNEPVAARPPSRVYRFQKSVYRNKLVFAAVAAIGAALFTGTLVSTWQAVRATRAELSATKSSATATQALLQLWRKTDDLGLMVYFNAMNLAFQEYKEGNLTRVSTLLEDCRPNMGVTDFRGFEWRYLYRVCHGNMARTLPKHKQVVGSMQFSPDSHLLATYCWDERLRLWDIEHNAVTPLFESTNAAGLSAFSAQGDQVIFGDNSGTIHFYDIGTHRTSQVISNAGQMVAFAALPQLLATFQDGSGIRIWDLKTRQVRFSLPDVQRRFLEFGWIEAVALDPNGKTLALVEPRPGAPGAHNDLGIRLRDLETGKDLGLLDDERQIRSFRYSASGEQLAVGSGEGTVRIWDLRSRQYKLLGSHESPVTALQFTPEGNELVSGGSDGSIKRWDLALQQELPNQWKGHLGPVTALSFSRDGRWLASGSRDTTVKLWPRDPGKSTDEVRGLNSDGFGNIAFAPDGRSIAAGFQDQTVKILDVETLTPRLVITGMLYVVAFTADSRHVLVSDPQNVAYWWDLETNSGQRLFANGGPADQMFCVDLSPDRRLAALGLGDGRIDILELQSGRRLASLKGHSGPVRTLQFSWDGTMLVSGGSDRFVRLWDVPHAKLLFKSDDKHRGSVCAAAFSPNGKTVVSGCGFGTIKLWNSGNFTNSVATIVGHASALRSLAFSHKGSTFVSGGEDRVVKFWNVPALLDHTLPLFRREVASLRVTDKVRLVEFSPDDNNLAIVTDDGVLRLLRAEPAESPTWK